MATKASSSSTSQRVVLKCIALAPQTTEEDLAAVFGLHGKVHNVNIPLPDRPTRGARMAFICMTPNVDGEDVIRNLQSMTIAGGKLIIRNAWKDVSRNAAKELPPSSFDKAFEDYQRLRGNPASIESFQVAEGLTDLGLSGIPKSIQESHIRSILTPFCVVVSIDLKVKSGCRTGHVDVVVRNYTDSPEQRTAIRKQVSHASQEDVCTDAEESCTGSPGWNQVSAIHFLQISNEAARAAPAGASPSPAGVQPSRRKVAAAMQQATLPASEAVQSSADLISLIDLEDDQACQAPILAFGSSSSSSEASFLPPTPTGTPSSSLSFQTAVAPPALPPPPPPPPPAGLSDELAALRKALVDLEDPRMLGQLEVILGILLMLPKKQRLKCLLSSGYLAVKAEAALHLLQAEHL